MIAEILRGRGARRAQPVGRQPRLRRRLRPPPGRATPSSASSRSTRRRCSEVARRVQPKALLLGNLFRDQLDRYGELELVAARWRDTVAALPEAKLVVNADDPQVGDLARVHGGARTFGLDDPRLARPALQHAADSKYCLRCGTPYEYAAAYVGHLGDYRCPNCGHARPALDVVAREIELHGLDGASFALSAPEGEARVELALPGLYNVYNAVGAASLALTLGVAARRRRRRAGALLGGVRALRADPGRRQAAADAPDQEPGRRERGGAHARRRCAAAGRRRRAQRRDRRRPRRLVDLGRRLRAADCRARARSSQPALARRSSRCASPTAASRAIGSRSCRRSSAPSTAGSS